MSAITQLLRLTDIYGMAVGKKPVTVSYRLFGDSKRLDQIRAGGDIQVKRLEGAVAWLSEHWPEGATWPADIPRPEHRAAA